MTSIIYQLTFYCFLACALSISFKPKYIHSTDIKGAIILLMLYISLSVTFMFRVILMRYFILISVIYMATLAILSLTILDEFQIELAGMVLDHFVFLILLTVGIHYREMVMRKSLNYDRVITVEMDKTNSLISKLVPLHMVSVIKNEKKQVDEFDNVTLLFTDMVGFTAFSNNVKDPKEVVTLLSKLFSRFDQLCEEFKVYKVHTIGDCYVIMGYNGKVDKSQRSRAIVVDECNRVIKVGLKMIDIIAEVRDQASSENIGMKQLDMRIGIHTGKFVAGIIGSKVVRYDIFGEGVLIANKMESNGEPGKVCISEDTYNTLNLTPGVFNEYDCTIHKEVELESLNKKIMSYIIEQAKKS